MHLTPAAWDDPDVRRLTADQQAELRGRYGGGQEPGTPPSAADVAVVLVARDPSGEAVGCGALRPLGDDVAEIKRMYVVPELRGRGVARALLRALEDAAREMGYARARLDTGPKQPHAEHLYRSAGYTAIHNFNDNPVASYWGEKSLR